MAFYYIAVSVLGFLVFWFFTSTFFASSFPLPPELRNKRIVLLIGHPDDEAMFFAPSVLALTRPGNGNHVQIICLSTGNAIGEGEIRKGELLNSARRLGIRHDEDVLIVDDPHFQDGPENDWKKGEIAHFLTKTFSPQDSASSKRTQARQRLQNGNSATAGELPDLFLTFDPYGISSHPNHCACHDGASYFLRHHLPRTSSKPYNYQQPKINLYTLTTLPTLRKYIHIFDAPLTLLSIIISLLIRRSRRGGRADRADRVIFVSGFIDYYRAFGAMVQAHKTQMLWFRWGWILTGRYMVVNDLRREVVAP
jgi:N-acetylglucosaminylphosphatidylinositol deacetylase